MAKDFYQVLGLNKDADPGRIRQAYRSEVKKCHPDASGTGASAARFRAVEEAYETLRDTARRHAYDRELSRRESLSRGSGGEPPRARSARGGGFGSAPFASPLDSFGLTGLAGLFGLSPLLGHGRTSEPLLEIVLSPEESRRGAAVAVEVPVVDLCPHCGDSGLWARLTCLACGGSGRVRSACRVTLELPPGVRHGSEFRCHLGPTADTSLGVRVLVESS